MNFLFQLNSDLSEQDTVIVIMLIVTAVLYFIPSIIALLRMKRNWVAIVALNFFSGVECYWLGGFIGMESV
ncbi:superinfection immunity protein [Aquimarina sp. 2201CG5-10]|uniref:superinfection immunity protein n=1 Tax=Aquimarina callyspongiae TaxID=3098150 RepID=UPI0039FD6AA3